MKKLLFFISYTQDFNILKYDLFWFSLSLSFSLLLFIKNNCRYFKFDINLFGLILIIKYSQISLICSEFELSFALQIKLYFICSKIFFIDLNLSSGQCSSFNWLKHFLIISIYLSKLSLFKFKCLCWTQDKDATIESNLISSLLFSLENNISYIDSKIYFCISF